MAQMALTIVQPVGYGASTCGYCSPKGERSKASTSKSYGAVIPRLSVQDYQAMIDRGWRRSGTYCYKPDMQRTCCPQYTIRLDAAACKPSKSQRQLLNRFKRFIHEGGSEGSSGFGLATADHQPEPRPSISQAVKGKNKSRTNGTFDLVQVLQSCETDFTATEEAPAHRFETTMEPASFTEEKYQLYKRYQMAIHGDSEGKVTRSGFKRFLCESPLESASEGLGSFHQMYRLDGKLIAIGVLDILPHAVSSVYLIWDPDWSGLCLGKVSALKEIALARELYAKGVLSQPLYYMGFYIHSCTKMAYKAGYDASYLLEPQTNTFTPFEQCTPLLDEDEHRVLFASDGSFTSTTDKKKPAPPSATASPSDAADSDSEWDDEDETMSFPDPFPGVLQPDQLPRDLIMTLKVIEGRTVRPFLMTSVADAPDRRRELFECVGALGPEVSERAFFYVP